MLRRSIQPRRFYNLTEEKCEYRRTDQATRKRLGNKSRKCYVNWLGAITAGQDMQQAKAGVEAIFLSGWQPVLNSPKNPAPVIIIKKPDSTCVLISAAWGI